MDGAIELFDEWYSKLAARHPEYAVAKHAVSGKQLAPNILWSAVDKQSRNPSGPATAVGLLFKLWMDVYGDLLYNRPNEDNFKTA
jgi:hypothetical protein